MKILTGYLIGRNVGENIHSKVSKKVVKQEPPGEAWRILLPDTKEKGR